MFEKFNAKKAEMFGELVKKLSSGLCEEEVSLLEWGKTELEKRGKMLVKERDSRGYSLCPCCYATIEFDYCAYCHVCGHGLRWRMARMKYVSWGEVMEREEQYKQEKRQRVKKKPAVVEEIAVPVEPPIVKSEPIHENIVQQITVNEVLDYLSTDKSAAENKVVVSCFSTIMRTLAEQIMPPSVR